MRITSRTRWIQALACGLTIGALDILFASLFWANRGVSLIQVAQSVASGWYGNSAFSGGVRTATIGLLSHFAIATVMAVLYFSWNEKLCARKSPWWLSGSPYGASIFFVMHLLVLPLSKAGGPDLTDDAWVLTNLGMHVVIGLICAKWSDLVETMFSLRNQLAAIEAR